jgi:multidrug efflux system membrane fusion protein
MSLQKTWVIHLSALGAMLLSVLLVGCDNSVAQNAAPPAPAVSAADVVVKSISQWDSFNGRIEAVESVQLRPRVSGYIDKVNYTDGQEVKKGEVLFTIDDRTYRAALEQAQANLARAKTQASLAQSEANRTDKLINTNWSPVKSGSSVVRPPFRRRPIFAPRRRRLTPRSSTWTSPK